MVGRRRGFVKGGAALAVAVLGAGLAGCASPSVTKVQVFVTRDKKVVLDKTVLRAGETILKVENDDGAKHVVVLARLTGATTLPVVDDRVPTGKRTKQRYTGSGYQVVAKSDTMSAYFNGP